MVFGQILISNKYIKTKIDPNTVFASVSPIFALSKASSNNRENFDVHWIFLYFHGRIEQSIFKGFEKYLAFVPGKHVSVQVALDEQNIGKSSCADSCSSEETSQQTHTFNITTPFAYKGMQLPDEGITFLSCVQTCLLIMCQGKY